MCDLCPRVPVSTLRGHEETVTCLSFGGSDGLLVSGCNGGELRLWRPRSGQTTALAQQQTAHDLGVTCCHLRSPTPAGDGTTDTGTETGGRCWAEPPDIGCELAE